MSKKDTRQKAEYVKVNQGDIVHINFIHYPESEGDKKEFDAKVIEVEHRYGYYNSGHTQAAPLVTYKNLKTGEVESADNGFVTHVVKYANYAPTPVNVYKDIYPHHAEFMHTKKRGVLCGELYALATFVLRSESHVPRPINPIRLKRVFINTPMGLIRTSLWEDTYYVRKKYFKAFLLKNLYRIMYTVKEIDDRETAQMTQWEEEAWEYIRKMDEELFEPFDYDNLYSEDEASVSEDPASISS